MSIRNAQFLPAAIKHEIDINWLVDRSTLPYVRCFVNQDTRTRQKPIKDWGPYKVVGYGILSSTAPNNGQIGGGFIRRVFVMIDEDSDPNRYISTHPWGSLAPMTIGPGIAGDLSPLAGGQ